jgi:hypothetical protein
MKGKLMTIKRLSGRRPALRRHHLATALVIAAAGIGLLATPALAGPSSTTVKSAGALVSPDVYINYFYGENAATSGSSAWQWLGGTASESFPNTTSRAVVTGSATFGSSNGLAVSGQLGVCYQPAAGGTILFGNWALIDFTAPAGQWVTQTFSGTILPGTNGYAAGTYKVGLCISQASANLTYNLTNGSLAGTATVAVNSGP